MRTTICEDVLSKFVPFAKQPVAPILPPKTDDSESQGVCFELTPLYFHVICRGKSAEKL